MQSKIFIISGPSGAGEDSIIEGLKKQFDIERVITTTTRDMRPGESHGQPYYFISREEFKKGIKNGEFFEWAEEDHNNFYGVTKKEIERAKNSGKIVIWKVDYKGVLTLKKILPEIPAILINAPLDVIEKRIRNRGGVSEKFIQERIKYAQGWTKNKNAFDYVVENEERKLKEAVLKVVEIIENSLG